MAAITTAPANKLTHVGFSPRAAAALRATTINWTVALRAGTFTPRQRRTLLATPLTLGSLIRGGFTRHQAKVILNG